MKTITSARTLTNKLIKPTSVSYERGVGKHIYIIQEAVHSRRDAAVQGKVEMQHKVNIVFN